LTDNHIGGNPQKSDAKIDDSGICQLNEKNRPIKLTVSTSALV